MTPTPSQKPVVKTEPSLPQSGNAPRSIARAVPTARTSATGHRCSGKSPRLLTLAEPDLAEVIAWLLTGATYKQIKARVAERFGLQCGQGALSEFFHRHVWPRVSKSKSEPQRVVIFEDPNVRLELTIKIPA